MTDFDFTTFPTLTTVRLTLRELRESDAADVFVFRGDPEVQKYNGPPMTDVSEFGGLFGYSREHFGRKEGLLWALEHRASGHVIGLVGLTYDATHARAALGYDLARAHWGRGLATEALAAVVRFGFETLNLNRIEADTIADNAPSTRVLEKLGFQREGLRRAYSLEDDGLYHDEAIYGLLRSEYAP